MKPSTIFDIMDLTRNVRKQGKVFNPLFVGPPGVGKSAIVQQWCRKNKLPFIDLRAAYLEAPDLIGFPTVSVVNGRQVTKHNPPEFWPSEGEGVIFLDEVNRGTTAVMNCFMQMLTDRKIHSIDIPDGWLIVSCINPENEHNDVNTMDSALKNRFQVFNVEYDKASFIEYMRLAMFDESVRLFVESGTWQYSKPEDVQENTPGTKYNSPRTIEQLNNVVQAGIKEDMELMMYQAILGNNFGKAFYTFKHKEQPVLYRDLVNNATEAIRRLNKFSDPKAYKNGHISITIRDIVEQKKIEDALLAKVLLALPADQGKVLLSELEFVRKDSALTTRIFTDFKEVKDYLRSNILVD